MRTATLIIAGLVLTWPAYAQSASADSAAIIALELEMSQLLSTGRIDEYAAHLTSDYARTTQQGRLELRDSALASWRVRSDDQVRGIGAQAPPTDLWVRVYGDAAVLTGAVGGTAAGSPRARITKTFVRRQGRWLLAALHGSTIAEARLADDVVVRRIAPGVWLHVTWGRSDGVLYPSNGLLVETGDGTLLVDTAWDDRQTALLLRWAADELGRPVRAAVVTHSHRDRTGGLGALAAAGLRAQGFAGTAALVHAATGRTIDTLPGLDTAAVTLAPGVQAYYPGRGHAPDNIVVYVAAQGVLFGGCLVKDEAATTLGNIADADLTHWPEAVHDVAVRFPDAATVVPGHGAVGGRGMLDASERLLRRLGPAARGEGGREPATPAE